MSSASTPAMSTHANSTAVSAVLRRYPSLISLIAGFFGAIANSLVGTPFDVVKARLQTSKQRVSAIAVALTILRKEGALALWSGVGAAFSSSATENVVLFFLQSLLKQAVLSRKQATELTVGETLATGSIVGLASATAICPFEVLKVRVQTSQKELTVVLKELLRQPSQFFAGLRFMWCFDVPYNGVSLATEEAYMKCCSWMGAAQGDLHQLLAGGIAGLVAWFLMLPVDMLKTLVQSSNLTTRALLSLAAAGYRDHGIAWFYPGLGPVLLRAFAANAALFFVVRKTEKTLGEMIADDGQEKGQSLG